MVDPVSKRGKARAPNRFSHSQRPHGLKRTPEAIDKFLAQLRAGRSVRQAAEAIGIGRRTAFDWRDADEEFAKQWQDAMDDGIDNLEDEAYRRGVDGVSRPVFGNMGEGQGTGIVGHVQEYSDTLLLAMLKGKRAGVFNTERVEHTGAGGGPVDHRITVEFVKSKHKDDE